MTQVFECTDCNLSIVKLSYKYIVTINKIFTQQCSGYFEQELFYGEYRNIELHVNNMTLINDDVLNYLPKLKLILDHIRIEEYDDRVKIYIK